MCRKPTLLVFTLGADAESRRRRLLQPRDRDQELWLRRSCLAAAIEAGKTAGCRVEVCSPTRAALPPGTAFLHQEGGTFGERLASALADLQRRYAGPVVVVASDVPALASRHIAAALGRIREDPERVALGPSPDGGIYLLALGRPLAGLAHAVRWGGPRVLGDLLRLLDSTGRPAAILDEPLRDLDRPRDLEAWLAAKPAAAAGPAEPAEIAAWSALRRALRRLLAQRRRPAVRRLPGAVSYRPLAPSAGRAPPLAP
jgi:2-phospho-L-lactate guanylyltransferase (CobY/MobA/RfbA family)